MTQTPVFQSGDVVLHPRRREWGEGTVEKATAVNSGGSPSQRLIVRFTHHGRVTIHTNVASLVHKETKSTMNRTTATKYSSADKPRGWLDSLAPTSDAERLWQLPEELTDPFASLKKRIAATLDSYRLDKSPRTLIDWAVAQSGLDDPLARFTRHELEQAFDHFARDRDIHLRELVRTAKRQGEVRMLRQVLTDRHPPAVRKAFGDAMGR